MQPSAAAIDTLAVLHVEAHGGDLERSLAAIPAGISTRATLADLGNPDVDATLDRLNSGGDSTEPGSFASQIAGHAVDPTTCNAQRYQILRQHARGGLGTVFVALDRELNREVALKQILDRHADDPTSRARFLLEAEVTGGLEHPGIVPVYGMGTYADGRPYYAMRFIRGDSLKETIDRYHADELLKTNRGMKSLELRKLLRRFTDVCNAIDFAHSRGVLHRDIKPGNIVVGKHGETLVVDWGLARAKGKGESVEPGEERPLVPSCSSGSAETLPGAAMGTPAFMSPEQAQGDLDHLGPRSDVYSLGATLYYLLTGQPPFEGDFREIFRAVEHGLFRAPRQLDPSIDRALEAICLKAMATRPEDRYATSRAVADDIERWLADEPVMACPESRIQRIGRWLRHHRTWTYAGAAAVLGIAIASTIGVVVVERGQRREAAARAQAETNYNLARQAVEDYFNRVSEDTLLKEQDSVDIRRLRGELLKTALPYYREFLRQHENDPRLRNQLAETQFRVGQIMRELGTPDAAISAFNAAITIWEALCSASPGDHDLPVHLAQSLQALGEQYAAIRKFPPALAALGRSRAILKTLADERPADSSLRAAWPSATRSWASPKARMESPTKGWNR